MPCVEKKERGKKKESQPCSWSSCIFSTLKGWCNTICFPLWIWPQSPFISEMPADAVVISNSTHPPAPRHNSNQVDSQSCSKVVCSFFFKFGCSFFFSEAPILPDFDIIPTELGRHCLLNSAHVTSTSFRWVNNDEWKTGEGSYRECVFFVWVYFVCRKFCHEELIHGLLFGPAIVGSVSGSV